MSDNEMPDAARAGSTDSRENAVSAEEGGGAWFERTAATAGSTDVSSAELKARFHAGSIPLAMDFEKLIEMAECGRRAVGRSADQADRNVGVGLMLAAETDAANKGKLSVKAGAGIAVDGRGVSIDPQTVLPRGLIVMFSGMIVPPGWALCDGTRQTPDLRNRFVLAGALDELDKKSQHGVAADKTYTAESDSKAPALKVKVDETELSVEQIPPHTHDVLTESGNALGWSDRDGIGPGGPIGYRLKAATASLKDHFYARSTGEGKGHTHTATASQDAHTHTTTITTPYYILAFIMKT